jgi:hypothetical protein
MNLLHYYQLAYLLCLFLIPGFLLLNVLYKLIVAIPKERILYEVHLRAPSIAPLLLRGKVPKVACVPYLASLFSTEKRYLAKQKGKLIDSMPIGTPFFHQKQIHADST